LRLCCILQENLFTASVGKFQSRFFNSIVIAKGYIALGITID
jgi:hypothetical protein